MQVLARPWNGLLMVVLEDGPLRFYELSERVPSIGDRMLAGRLKELERQGLIVRRVDPGPPVRVTYALTDVGWGFREVASAVRNWGKLILQAQDRSASKAERPRTRAARA
jgi:DNA-binding HxlR family transcriptional regulator